MAEQAKVIFLLCDDEQEYRERHKSLLEGLLRRSFDNIPHEIHVFDDGAGPLKFLEQRKDAKGIVLISDHDMVRVTGSDLFRGLDAKGLLPENTFLCSRMQPEYFQLLVIDALGIADAEKKIKLLPKQGVGFHFARNLPEAIQVAGREVGIDLVPRPTASVSVPSSGAQPR